MTQVLQSRHRVAATDGDARSADRRRSEAFLPSTLRPARLTMIGLACRGMNRSRSLCALSAAATTSRMAAVSSATEVVCEALAVCTSCVFQFPIVGGPQPGCSSHLRSCTDSTFQAADQIAPISGLNGGGVEGEEPSNTGSSHVKKNITSFVLAGTIGLGGAATGLVIAPAVASAATGAATTATGGSPRSRPTRSRPRWPSNCPRTARTATAA